LEEGLGENTVFVVMGDHTAYKGALEDKLMSTHRRIFFRISEVPEAASLGNREFLHFDVLPTTLEALDFMVPDGKLALGTSIFSPVAPNFDNDRLRFFEELNSRSELLEGFWTNPRAARSH